MSEQFSWKILNVLHLGKVLNTTYQDLISEFHPQLKLSTFQWYGGLHIFKSFLL